MSADLAPAERLHPLALLSGVGQAARNLFGGIAAGGYLAFQGRRGTALLVLGGIVAVTLTGVLLGWLRFSFRVGTDAIRIDSGILHRNHRTIPFDRVADVSIAQGPLQRLAGIARVTLETGSSTAGKEEGVLAGIALARAEALRDHIRARRGLQPAASSAVDAEEAAPLFAMDPKRVLTCGLFNFSLALFAGLFGASQTLGDLLKVDPFEREFWRPLLVQSGWGEWLLGHRVALAAGGILVLVLAGIVTGLVRTVLREWGFRLERTGNGFRRRRGLLTRTDVSLPLRRVQALVVETGPVREHFGWYRLKVQSLAADTDPSGKGVGGDHVLAPLARWDELQPVAGELRLQLPGPGTPWRRVSKAHLWTMVVLALPVFPLLLVLAPLRWLEWRHTAYALEGGLLLVRTGWWSRRTVLLPVGNVQTIDLLETSLSRRFGVARLAIGTAGGSLRGLIIPALPRKEASQLRGELLSERP